MSLDRLRGINLRSLFSGHVRSLYWQYRGQQEMAKTGRPFDVPARSQWDGGRNRAGKQVAAVWPRLTEFYWKHKLDPETCVALVFIRAASVVYPNQLTGPKWLQAFQAATEQTSRLRAESLASEKEVCRQELVATASHNFDSKESHWEFTLLNDELPMSPLFRWCVGHSAKLDSVMREYVIPAAIQYATLPDVYDKAWQEVLSPEFCRLVREGMRAEVAYATKK